MEEWIRRLRAGEPLNKEQWKTLIGNGDADPFLFQEAVEVRQAIYGRDIYIRGLIELTNYCKNDCLYCGIRRSNRQAERYRLRPDQVLACCQMGYDLGFRTFVLQGGEDPAATDAFLCGLIREIKAAWPDCAVTLSMGERSHASYQALREAGADRYLLRHETACPHHYQQLHPPDLHWENRIHCLEDLADLGYQTGSGFMVGSPGQTVDCLAQDMLLLARLRPQMVGIGPFLPHHDTPFAHCPPGRLDLTLRMVALTRLLLPQALIPATTALATLDPQGRELGILAGANVVMPNLSPPDVREKYLLYDNKAHSGLESAEAVAELKASMERIGYRVVTDRGDWKPSHS